VDIETVLAQSSLADHGIPGSRLFLDHVHPTFEGTHLLASAVASRIMQMLGPDLGHSVDPKSLPSPRACAQALVYTDYEALNIQAAIVRLTGQPPFLDQLNHGQRQAEAERALHQFEESLGPTRIRQVLAIYAAALARQAQDWPVHYNYATLCLTLKRYGEAVEHLSLLARDYPRHATFKLALADALAQSGQLAAAREQVSAVLRLDPSHPLARQLEKTLWAQPGARP
jgi:tetratricopeptide (TPR) repeat protein